MIRVSPMLGEYFEILELQLRNEQFSEHGGKRERVQGDVARARGSHDEVAFCLSHAAHRHFRCCLIAATISVRPPQMHVGGGSVSQGQLLTQELPFARQARTRDPCPSRSAWRLPPRVAEWTTSATRLPDRRRLRTRPAAPGGRSWVHRDDAARARPGEAMTSLHDFSFDLVKCLAPPPPGQRLRRLLRSHSECVMPR